jgi:transposase
LTALCRRRRPETAERDLIGAEQDVQVRVARDLVSRCRSLTRSIVELDRELEQRTAATAPALLELPGCGALTAAKLLAESAAAARVSATHRTPPQRRQ